MNSIYIVDYIGVHCGMHYYLEAFKKNLQIIGNIEVRILSNYGDAGHAAFFLNQFKGTYVNKVFSLVRNYFRLKNFLKKHKEDTIIYLTYGNITDLPFMKLVSRLPYHIIDIHEAIAQNVDSNSNLKKQFEKIYKYHIKTVISHSTRTDAYLKEYGFNGYHFKVPHFRYIFPKEYDIDTITPEIRRAVEKEKINLLFFGNLTENKGVDILIEAVNKLNTEDANKLSVIIAGKDFDGSVDRIKPQANRNIKIFRRHITDDELRYLYQNVDYISLPYRKTSQSGILEMAFYYKRPIIATNIPYFQLTLKQFPSFGILSGGDSTSYSTILSSIIASHGHINFYKDHEYMIYENRNEVCQFQEELTKWLLNTRKEI